LDIITSLGENIKINFDFEKYWKILSDKIKHKEILAPVLILLK
jgi:hypothetical protein